jgi:uncharacterized protein YmfQ (DUF2313 family)
MAYDSSAYLQLLQRLLPKGKLWTVDPGSTLTKVLQAMADELARVDARSDVLLNEAKTTTTIELITDFEREYGLPDDCFEIEDTITERQAVVNTKFKLIGRLDKQYYIDLAKNLGLTITITEFQPFWCGQAIDKPCGDNAVLFHWEVAQKKGRPDYIRPFRRFNLILAPFGESFGPGFDAVSNDLELGAFVFAGTGIFICGESVCGESLSDAIFTMPPLNNHLNFQYFICGSSVCGDPLIKVPGFAQLKCFLEQIKPAHTIIDFTFPGPAFDRSFGNAFDNWAKDDPGIDGAFDREFSTDFDIFLGGEFEQHAFDASFSRLP